LTLTSQTEQLLSEVMTRNERTGPEAARTLARVASAIMFVTMAATINAGHTVDEVVAEIEGQVRAILPPE